MLLPNNTHRGKLTITYTPDKTWTVKTQLNYAHAFYQKGSNGWLFSQSVACQQQDLKAQLSAAYFKTDSYDSRVYAYERQLPHEYAFPMFYGRGYRLALTARADISPSWQLNMKVGHTHYNDRSVIGSGLQEIAGSSMTDLDMQVRWRF